MPDANDVRALSYAPRSPNPPLRQKWLWLAFAGGVLSGPAWLLLTINGDWEGCAVGAAIPIVAGAWIGRRVHRSNHRFRLTLIYSLSGGIGSLALILPDCFTKRGIDSFALSMLEEIAIMVSVGLFLFSACAAMLGKAFLTKRE